MWQTSALYSLAPALLDKRLCWPIRRSVAEDWDTGSNSMKSRNGCWLASHGIEVFSDLDPQIARERERCGFKWRFLSIKSLLIQLSMWKLLASEVTSYLNENNNSYLRRWYSENGILQAFESRSMWFWIIWCRIILFLSPFSNEAFWCVNKCDSFILKSTESNVLVSISSFCFSFASSRKSRRSHTILAWNM